MATIKTNIRAIVVAVSVFVTLTAIVIYFHDTYEISDRYHEYVVLGLTLFSVTLISALTYQSYRVFESARAMARGMTRNMLVESQDLFSELYRNSPVPYLVINERAEIDSMNIAAARFFHVELDALEGIDVFSFLSTSEDTQKNSLIPEYFKKDKPVNEVEVCIQRPDKIERWALLSLFPFRNAKGRRMGLLTLVDITQQKKIDKAKTEFVSLASHQLRTPISAMKWNVELLTSAHENQSEALQSSYIEKIERNLARMEMLINDFLNVSKLELGTLVPEYTQIDLASFLRSIQDEYSALATTKGVTIQIVLDRAPEDIMSDTQLLHMVVSNLVGNAVKYSSKNGEVRVVAEVVNREIHIRITDTGIGIPDEEQEMLFTKLFRASNAKKQSIEGTGLGLYVVREAVRVLGGDIRFESVVGQGTTFVVMLPV